MEGDSELGDMVSQKREEYRITTCDFTADDEKPWEISVRKGTSLKVLESTTVRYTTWLNLVKI